MKNEYGIIELVKNSLPSVIDMSKFQYIEDDDIGYFGRINSKDFITYKKLCDKLDFYEGVVTDDAGWLLFWHKGELLYISQHPVRHNVSWESLNNNNLVYGKRSVEIGDNNYSIMLPTGGDVVDEGEGSMWNDLIYKVHEEFGIWDKLTDEELNVNWGKCPIGSSSWCQESYEDYMLFHTHRGGHRLTYLDMNISSYSVVDLGARFVLKLNKDIGD